jgi:hypothetical protein
MTKINNGESAAESDTHWGCWPESVAHLKVNVGAGWLPKPATNQFFQFTLFTL